jgi:hypothetical protein
MKPIQHVLTARIFAQSVHKFDLLFYTSSIQRLHSACIYMFKYTYGLLDGGHEAFHFI